VVNERLRAQRLALGWSREDVVQGLVRVGIKVGERQLGVTRNLVSRWEREGTIPRAPYPKLLCLLFHTSAKELGLVVPYPSGRASITIEGYTFEDGGDGVERRDFLCVAGTAAVGAFLPWKASPALPDGSLGLSISRPLTGKADDFEGRPEPWFMPKTRQRPRSGLPRPGAGSSCRVICSRSLLQSLGV
jgi:transcriptional regulator with XRE-family HTH domain